MLLAAPPTRLPNVERASAGARVLVVAGSVARCGASACAAVLAASAAAMGVRVGLVDAAGGAQRALLGAWGDGGESRGPVAVSETLSLLAAEGDALGGAVAGAARGAALVVVDAGSRLDGVRRALDAAVDGRPAGGRAGGRNPAVGLLVVTGADAEPLAAAYALVKALAPSPAGLPADAVEVVVTGADPAAGAEAAARLDAGTRHFLGRPLLPAALVPADPTLAVALAAGLSVHDAAAGSPAAAALQLLAARWASPAAPLPSASRLPLA